MKYQNLFYLIFLFSILHNANNQMDFDEKRSLKEYSNTTYCENITNPIENDDCFGVQVEDGYETCCFIKTKNTTTKEESRACIPITVDQFQDIKGAITNMTKDEKTLKIETLDCDHSFNIYYYSLLSLILIVLLL